MFLMSSAATSSGRIGTGIGNEALVTIALSQVGNGGATYWSWYGFGSRVEWCAYFVSWCADQCGSIDAGTIPKFSLCSAGAAWFAARGWLIDASSVSSPGDIVFFDWGNSGDRVRQRGYSLGSSGIYGYGIMR